MRLTQFIEGSLLNSISNPYRAIYMLIFAYTLSCMNLDIYLPSLHLIIDEFNISASKAQQIFIISFWQSTFMPLIWGPLSDYIGRRKVLIIALFISLIGQFLSIMSYTINFLLICRVIQYIGSGALGSITISSIHDLLRKDDRPTAIALFKMSMPVALLIAPMVGAAVSENFGWRVNFLFLGILHLTAYILIIINFPLDKAIYKDIKYKKLLPIFYQCISNLEFMRLTIILSFIEAVLLVFINHSSFFYMEKHGLNAYQYSFCQTISALFYIFGLIICNNKIYPINLINLFKLGVLSHSAIGIGLLFVLFGILKETAFLIFFISCLINLIVSITSLATYTIVMEIANEQIKGTISSFLNFMTGCMICGAMLISNYLFDDTMFYPFLVMLILCFLIFILGSIRVVRNAPRNLDQ